MEKVTRIHSIRTEEIYICEAHDRIIYIERNMDREITGLNFMQGAGDIECFDVHKKNDADLLELYTDFIKRFNNLLVKDQELEIINEFLWMTMNNDNI